MSIDPFIGQIIMFAGNFAPRGWAFCNGALLSISQNTALFAILGTTFGGDGRTTFGLPNLKDRAPMHAGNGPGLTQRRLGATGGLAAATVSLTEIPSHTHSLSGHDNTAGPGVHSANTNQDTPAATRSFGAVPGSALGFFPNVYGPATTTVDMPEATADTGGGLAHPNEQPFQAINFIIALVGTFPSRN